MIRVLHLARDILGFFGLYGAVLVLEHILRTETGQPVVESLGALTAVALLHPSVRIKALALLSHVVLVIVVGPLLDITVWGLRGYLFESLQIAVFSSIFLSKLVLKRRGEVPLSDSLLFISLAGIGAPLIVGVIQGLVARDGLPVSSLLETKLPNIAASFIVIPVALVLCNQGVRKTLNRGVTSHQMVVTGIYALFSYIVVSLFPVPALLLSLGQLIVVSQLTYTQSAVTALLTGTLNAYLYSQGLLREPGLAVNNTGSFYGYVTIFAASGMGTLFALMGAAIKRKIADAKNAADTNALLLSKAPAMLFTVSQKGNIEFVSESFLAKTGYAPTELIGGPVSQVVRNGNNLLAMLLSRTTDNSAYADIEVSILGKFQEEFPANIAYSCITVPATGELLTTFFVVDISAQKVADRKVGILGQTDAVTGLCNQDYFDTLVSSTVTKAQASSGAFTVVTLGLQTSESLSTLMSFRALNEYLRSIGQLIKSHLRANDIVSKGGAFDFVLLLNQTTTPSEINVVIRKIQEAIKVTTPTIAPDLLNVSFSAGVARFPADTKDAQELVKFSGLAFHRAIQDAANGAIEYFNGILDLAPWENLKQHKDILDAIQKDEFGLVYQPKIHTLTGEIDSVEALLRWNRPGSEAVTPGEFLGTALTHNLMVDLGAIVLKEACGQMKSWLDTQVRLKSVSVNVSAQELWGESFYETVKSALDTANLDGRYLDLEIQEQTILKAPPNGKQVLEKLRGLGVTFTLTAAGIGGPLLQHIKRFPITALKLEKSVVKFAFNEIHYKRVLESVISAAKISELPLIVEGVESEEQAQTLQELHVDFMQGYYFGSPTEAFLLTPSISPKKRQFKRIK